MDTKIKLLMLVGLIIFSGVFKEICGQSSSLGNARSNAAWFLGWNNSSGTSGSLEIKNEWNDNINFSTNTTQKATIQANGNVGIGTAAPAHLLEVDGGDISIADYNQGLRIGGSPGVTPSIPSAVVLSLWGCTSCLYVGYDAGGANTTGGANAFIACASSYTNNTSKQKLRSIEPTRFINPVNN